MKFYCGCWGLAVMVIASLAFAQAQVEPVATRPGDDAAALIAPFLDDQTIFIAHIDMAKIDVDAAIDFFKEGIPEKPGERAAAKAFFSGFLQAGGRHVFFVLAQSDLWPNMQRPSALIPLEAGHDPHAMVAILKTFPVPTPPVLLNDYVLFVGGDMPLQRLRALKPVPRPEVAEVFAANPASAIQVLVVPTADNRRVLREMMPTLPAEFGGGSTAFVYEGMKYLSANIVWPPKVELAIRSEFTTDAYATQCEQTIKQLVAVALAKPETKAAMTQPWAETLQAAITLVQNPTVSHSTLSYRLEQKQIQDVLFKVMLPSLARAREQARRVASMQQLKELMVKCHSYANSRNAWPETLQDLVAANLVKPEEILSPADPKRRPYVYRKPSAEEQKKTDGGLPVIWEQGDDDAAPMSVGFMDAHSETFSSRAEARKAFARVGVTLP